jgi:hypothetical protein
MAGIAKQFTNAELQGSWRVMCSSLDGELKTVPEKRFR